VTAESLTALLLAVWMAGTHVIAPASVSELRRRHADRRVRRSQP
jgi:hypothetical protein